MSTRNQRMETLRNSGANVNQFFDVNLRVPLNAEVKITVNGTTMTIDQLNEALTNGIFDVSNIGSDVLAQSIVANGYVRSSQLFRRWITAHTFKMLNYQAWGNPNRKGWEACMKDHFDYNYQFKMMLEEIRILSVLQNEDSDTFNERVHFFNGGVVIETLRDYLRRFKKYVNKQIRTNPHTYRGQQYVKLATYGSVLVINLDRDVYNPISLGINNVVNAVSSNDYHRIYGELRTFMNVLYNKLPYDTTKCATWKDAFKGSGAFYSLLNLVRFHHVVLDGCNNQYDSEEMLYSLLNGSFNGATWKFHQLLVNTIESNNFDLSESIAAGNAAPNTHSDRASRYRR